MLRTSLVAAGFLAGLSVALLPPAQRQSERKPPAAAAARPTAARPAPDRSADEAAIHTNVDAFVKAYNAGDAKAIAALFAPDGQIIDEEGATTEGRDGITQV